MYVILKRMIYYSECVIQGTGGGSQPWNILSPSKAYLSLGILEGMEVSTIWYLDRIPESSSELLSLKPEYRLKYVYL